MITQCWFLAASYIEASDEPQQSLLDKLQLALTEWLEQCQQADLTDELELSVVSVAWLEGFSAQGLAQACPQSGGRVFAQTTPWGAGAPQNEHGPQGGPCRCAWRLRQSCISII